MEAFLVKNKNTELEKKIANLEKQNAELTKKQQEQQNLAIIKTSEIKKEEKIKVPSKPKKISNYEGKLENRVANYDARRDKVSDENGWSVEETQANEALNEKLDDELTKVYNLTISTTYKLCRINGVKYTNIRVDREVRSYNGGNVKLGMREDYPGNRKYCADIDYDKRILNIYQTNAEEC